jgi:hypothetical protein
LFAGLALGGAAAAQERPWMDASLPAAERAQLALDQMTEQ